MTSTIHSQRPAHLSAQSAAIAITMILAIVHCAPAASCQTPAPSGSTEGPNATTRKAAEQAKGETLLKGAARTAFMKRAEKSMAKVRTVVARFAQNKHIAAFDDIAKSTGFIVYQSPDRLRWEYRKPFRSILIVAGKDVAKFEFLKGRRRRLKLGRSRDMILVVMDQIRGWFRGDFVASEKKYVVKMFDGKRPRIELAPRDASLAKMIARIELVLRPDLSSVRRVTIFERGGDKTEMLFEQLPRRAKLDASFFDVTEPKPIDPKALEKPTSRKSK